MIVALLLAAPCLSMAQSAPPIFADGAKWQEVSRTGLAWAEGVVAAKDGTIYMCDITHKAVIKVNNPVGTIYRYDPKTGVTTKYMEPSGMCNGLNIDIKGDLIIAQGADGGGRAVLRRNLKTGATTVLANSYQNKRLNAPNDITSDEKGRIYFTDSYFQGDEIPELPNAVYRLDPDGKLSQISTDVLRPNGVEISADNKHLYVMATNYSKIRLNPNGPAKDKFGIASGGVVEYDVDRNGNISNPRPLYRTEEFSADGSAMDTDNNLYVALHNGNSDAPKAEIVVISPSGQIQHLPSPGVGLTTNLGFGRGADSHTLYATTGSPWRLFRIQTVRTGYYPK
jgi:gluconolactonase